MNRFVNSWLSTLKCKIRHNLVSLVRRSGATHQCNEDMAAYKASFDGDFKSIR